MPVDARLIRPGLAAQEFGLSANTAHLVFLRGGAASLSLPDLAERGFDAPELIWVPAGDPARLRLDAGSGCTHMRLAPALLERIEATSGIGRELRRSLAAPLGLRTPEPVVLQVAAHLDLIQQELAQNRPATQTMVLSLATMVIINLWRLAGAGGGERAEGVPLAPADRFALLEVRHRREHWKVADYARSMGLSRDRLTSEVQRATGLSPQEYLHAGLMREARDLLENSNLKVAEIAYRLGFHDPAYFNRFFRRLGGQPPGRSRHRDGGADTTPRRGSFAAWP